MTDELKFPNSDEGRAARDANSLDERTSRAIHELYLPPVESESAYWSMLESRIMSRIGSADAAMAEQSWMSVLNGWAQIGLVAATALFAIGGVISNRLGEPEEQSAYELVSSTPEAISAPATLMTSSDKSSQRDAALQYVLSY
jgi:hypothetical protein